MKLIGAIFALCILTVTGNSSFSLSRKLLSSSKEGDDDKLSRKLQVLKVRGGSAPTDWASIMDWRFFLAGGACAAFSHGITTPIDVIKTRMQAFPEKYKDGMIAAARDIISSEGLLFLLAGLGPTIVGYGLEGALKFGFYETFKVVFGTLTTVQLLNYVIASVIAGSIASIVLCPMEDARIKMVGDASWSKESLISALARLLREKGLLSMFSGLAAMLSKQVPYTIGKQVSFDLISKAFHRWSTHIPSYVSKEAIKWCISTLSAFFAAICACLCSQPGDMILTATYGGGHGHAHGVENISGGSADKSFPAVVSSIYKKYGLAGFYMGLQARLAHVVSIITSQLVMYDILKTALGLSATGSH